MVSRRVRTNDELMQIFDLYYATRNNVLFRMETELREQGTKHSHTVCYNIYSAIEPK